MLSAERFREAAGRENAGRGRQGYRYSEELQASAVIYLRAALSRGASKAEVCSELGVSSVTLERWSRSVGTGAFRQVELIEDGESAMKSDAVLVSPEGYRVEGLTIGEIASLLRELR